MQSFNLISTHDDISFLKQDNLFMPKTKSQSVLEFSESPTRKNKRRIT